MSDKKKQTIRQYAKTSEIPLKQALNDLKIAGFYCNADDELNRIMRQELLSNFRARKATYGQLKQVKVTSAKIQKEIDELDRQISEIIDEIEKKNTDVEVKASGWGRKIKHIFGAQPKSELESKLDEESKLDDLKKQKEIKLKEKQEAIKEASKLKQQIEDEAEAIELKRQKEAEAIEFKRQKEAEAIEFKRQKEAEAIEFKRQKEAEAIEFKRQKEAKQLNQHIKKAEPQARKIGQLINLCCELIPAPIAQKIITDCQKQLFKKTKGDSEWLSNNQILSDIYLNSFLCELKIYVVTNNFSPLITVPEWISSNYGIARDMQWLPVADYNNDINNHKKHNRYTTALIETIYYLLINPQIKHSIIQSNSPFYNLNTIGELFIDMGATDSALRLYKIDTTVFNTPNSLSLLAKKTVQSGNLEDSINLVGKLIEQEPYHPAISTIQAEIKRLEQRHRLKATFAIDFSKINELSGVEFENLLLDKFVAMGFKVESTPNTGDFGADLIVENNEGNRIVVQCKRFKSKVNLKAVQEVVGAIGHYRGDMGLVITNNSFLNSAVKLAESHDIELWDGDKLVSFLAGDLSFSEIMGSVQLAIGSVHDKKAN